MKLRNENAAVYRLGVPSAFWRDHADRQPVDEGGSIARAIGVGARVTTIEATKDQINALWADAKFYADPDATDAEAWLRRSAAATVKAIEKQARKSAACVTRNAILIDRQAYNYVIVSCTEDLEGRFKAETFGGRNAEAEAIAYATAEATRIGAEVIQ
jgi:hypothetical protein